MKKGYVWTVGGPGRWPKGKHGPIGEGGFDPGEFGALDVALIITSGFAIIRSRKSEVAESVF